MTPPPLHSIPSMHLAMLLLAVHLITTGAAAVEQQSLSALQPQLSHILNRSADKEGGNAGRQSLQVQPRVADDQMSSAVLLQMKGDSHAGPEGNSHAGPADGVKEVVLFNEDFDPSIHEGKWSNHQGGNADKLCGAVTGNAYRFASSKKRELTTQAIKHPKTVSFSLKYGDGRQGCDKPEGDEYVTLQYSVGLLDQWQDLKSFPKLSEFKDFEKVTLAVPPDAQTSDTTRFRWKQMVHDGFGQDSWAVDEIMILGTPPTTHNMQTASPASNCLFEISATTATMFPLYSCEQSNYTLTLHPDSTETTLRAFAKDSTASVSIHLPNVPGSYTKYSQSLQITMNTATPAPGRTYEIDVVPVASNVPTRTYTVSVMKIIDESVSLHMLEAMGVMEMKPLFQPEYLHYTAWVPYTTKTITIKAVPMTPAATNLRYQNGAWKQFRNVMEDLPLEYGYNHFLIKVLKNGNEKVYKLVIVRWAGEAKVGSCDEAGSCSLVFKWLHFSHQVTHYLLSGIHDGLDLPAAQKFNHVVSRGKWERDVTIVEEIVYNLMPRTYFEIRIKASSPATLQGEPNATALLQKYDHYYYSMWLPLARITTWNNDATLTWLNASTLTPWAGFNQVELAPVYNPLVLKYKIIVAKTTDTIDLLMMPKDRNAIVTIQFGKGKSGVAFGEHKNLTLNIGSNKVIVQVTAENRVDVNDYELDIIRTEKASNDASLKSIRFETGSVVPDFAPKLYQYTVLFDHSVKGTCLAIEKNDQKASAQIRVNNDIVENQGCFLLRPGVELSVYITVIAEDTFTEAVTIVKVLRKGNPVSHCELLAVVPKCTLHPHFVPTKPADHYFCQVPYNVDTVHIIAYAPDGGFVEDGDFVQMGDDGRTYARNISLSGGWMRKENKFEVTCASQGHSMKSTYQLTITRSAKQQAPGFIPLWNVIEEWEETEEPEYAEEDELWGSLDYQWDSYVDLPKIRPGWIRLQVYMLGYKPKEVMPSREGMDAFVAEFLPFIDFCSKCDRIVDVWFTADNKYMDFGCARPNNRTIPPSPSPEENILEKDRDDDNEKDDNREEDLSIMRSDKEGDDNKEIMREEEYNIMFKEGDVQLIQYKDAMRVQFEVQDVGAKGLHEFACCMNERMDKHPLYKRFDKPRGVWHVKSTDPLKVVKLSTERDPTTITKEQVWDSMKEMLDGVALPSPSPNSSPTPKKTHDTKKDDDKEEKDDKKVEGDKKEEGEKKEDKKEEDKKEEGEKKENKKGKEDKKEGGEKKEDKKEASMSLEKFSPTSHSAGSKIEGDVQNYYAAQDKQQAQLASKKMSNAFSVIERYLLKHHKRSAR